MSEYRHFIAYIYEYQDGIKKKNAGFVKVNIRNGICRMQLKLQTDPKRNAQYSIYGFVHEGEWIYGMLFGTASLKNGLCEGMLTVQEAVLGQQGYGFGELSGLWIQNAEEQESLRSCFVTIWDERSVKWEHFVTELPKEPAAEEAESSAKESLPEEKQEEQEVAAQEAEAAKTELDSRPGLNERWTQFQYHYPQTSPFEDEEICECIQIAPKDIAFLGEQERAFCSSPFVQQKYMKYHHLLLGKHQNGRYILAVPGLNRNVQDRNLAAMYGFPEFKKTEEENGYWYHFLS